MPKEKSNIPRRCIRFASFNTNGSAKNVHAHMPTKMLSLKQSSTFIMPRTKAIEKNGSLLR